MKKLKLELESLQVESFETVALSRDGGTVRGHTGGTCDLMCDPTAWESCSFLVSCDVTCGGTAGATCIRHATCANTCPVTCGNTCEVSCHGCMTGGCGNLTVNVPGDSAAADCLGGPGNTM